MNTEYILFTIIAACIILSAILFVIFGQVTVRKLRKNPETRDSLGFEYVSGWDILNTAQALAIPRFIARKLETSPISFLHANVDILYEHTNKFDRFLARLFYWLYLPGSLALLTLIMLSNTGFFE